MFIKDQNLISIGTTQNFTIANIELNNNTANKAGIFFNDFIQ